MRPQHFFPVAWNLHYEILNLHWVPGVTVLAVQLRWPFLGHHQSRNEFPSLLIAAVLDTTTPGPHSENPTAQDSISSSSTTILTPLVVLASIIVVIVIAVLIVKKRRVLKFGVSFREKR